MLSTSYNLYTDNQNLVTDNTITGKFHKSTHKNLDEIETNIPLLSDLIDINYCSGVLLDNLASIVGTSRNLSETDSELRIKIMATAQSIKSNGSPKDIINVIKKLDNTNIYFFEQNQKNDYNKYDGSFKYDGTKKYSNYYRGQFIFGVDILDTDEINYSVADFINQSRASGDNGTLQVNIKLTNLTYNNSPVGTVFNGNKYDGSFKYDGTKKYFPYSKNYSVDEIRLYNENNVLIKTSKYIERTKNDIYIYSELLNEKELNNQFIKKIEFWNLGSINFYQTFINAIEKRNTIKILFYKENL